MADIITYREAGRIAASFDDGAVHGLARFAETGEIVTEGELDVITDVEDLIAGYEAEGQRGLCAELNALLAYLKCHEDG